MSAIEAPQARDLSVEEIEARAEFAKALENAIIEDIQRGRQDLWMLCQHLHAFHEQEGWTALSYDTQEEWLAQPEIGMSRSEYMRCVRRYRVYVVNREVPMERLRELDHSKLDIVQTAVRKNVKPLEDILRDVESMGARDLREEYIGVGDDGASEAKSSKPMGGAADDDDDVIDVTARSVESEEPQSEQDKTAEKVLEAAAKVDSWIDLGGDRRKAIRNWKRLTELHPVFHSISRINALMDGEEDAPDRGDAKGHWVTICEALDFHF